MRPFYSMIVIAAVALVATGCQTASSDVRFPRGVTKSSLDRDARASLTNLYAAMPLSKELAPKAKAILIFPRIVKAGLVVGGQIGDGVLLSGGKTTGYYNTVSASYGLQAGAQTFGYALFFMSDDALAYLKKSEGWEVGVGPSLVVVDEGVAKTLTTTTAKEDVYAFIFSQKGLMAGIGIQGSKISAIDPADR